MGQLGTLRADDLSSLLLGLSSRLVPPRAAPLIMQGQFCGRRMPGLARLPASPCVQACPVAPVFAELTQLVPVL